MCIGIQEQGCTPLHPGVACSVKMNYHNLNVILVILSTVRGRPNQFTHPIHLGPVHFSNVWCHIFITETLVCVYACLYISGWIQAEDMSITYGLIKYISLGEKVLGGGDKVVELSSSFLKGLQCSGLSCRLETNHNTLQKARKTGRVAHSLKVNSKMSGRPPVPSPQTNQNTPEPICSNMTRRCQYS